MSVIAKAKYLLRQFPFVYPSKIVYSCQEWILQERKHKGVYFSQRGAWFEDIFPEEFLHHPSPQTFGTPNDKAFYNNKDYPTDKATLFYLPNSYLLGHKGLILNKTHQVFQQFSHHFGISTLRRFLWKNPFYIFSKNVKKVADIGAVLVSPESHNYYHWLNDVLPRIRLYESVLDKVDHFCISSKVPVKFLNILAEFNIPKEKILLVNEREKLHFDHLYVATLPGSEGRSPTWAVNYIREHVIKSNTAKVAAKKIYFKRGLTVDRKILNEDTLIQILQNIGFEIINPDELTIAEQIELMQQTKLVVSTHGAALSNLLFIQEGMSVIEFFSIDYFRTDCYFTLASILNLNYQYLLGTKPAHANWGDMEVSEEALLNAIMQVN